MGGVSRSEGFRENDIEREGGAKIGQLIWGKKVKEGVRGISKRHRSGRKRVAKSPLEVAKNERKQLWYVVKLLKCRKTRKGCVTCLKVIRSPVMIWRRIKADGKSIHRFQTLKGGDGKGGAMKDTTRRKQELADKS